MTDILIDIQRSSDQLASPGDEEIASWVKHILATHVDEPEVIELSIRLVDNEESAALNQTYRNKLGPTNVLSFPFESPPGLPPTADYRLLGDIVICAPLVAQEASSQGKSQNAHWAHLVAHGVLHLLGYDHQNTSDAQAMESQEIKILSYFNIADPYQAVSTTHPNEIY